MNSRLFRTGLRASVSTSAAVARFARNDNGSATVVLSLTVPVLLAVLGVSVEYTRVGGMIVQAQAAADAAVLAAGADAMKPTSTQAARQSIATTIVNSSFGPRGASLGLTTTETDVQANLWQVTVTGTMPSLMGQFFKGIVPTKFSVTSQATNNGVTAAKPLEMALALDNTGSMSNNMSDLKNAAKSLVQTVMNGGNGAARVSVVPYVATVNPGLTDAASIAAYIDTTAANPWTGSWMRDGWITQNAGCTPNWGSGGSGGAGSGGSGDARDILDILKPIRHLAQELFGVTAAHADTTANTKAPLTTTTWKSPKTAKTYTLPTSFTTIAKDAWGAGSTGGCEWLANPSVVSPIDLFKRTLDANGNPVAWKGCVEARMSAAEQTWLNNNWGYSYTATDFDVTDAAPGTADSRTLFTPYFWPDEPDYSPWTWAYVAPGAYNGSTTQGFHNNYMDDGAAKIPSGWGWTTLSSVNWGGGQWILKYDSATKAAIIRETPDSNGFTYGPNAGCPDPILRLTNNQGQVMTKIDSAAYWQSGGTIIAEGLMWAWRSLSPNAPFADGKPYGTAGVTKAIVLMTDGVNELIDNGNNSSSLNTANVSDYSAYGYLGGSRLNAAVHNPTTGGNGIGNYTDVASFFDNRLLAACTNAKAQGIKIYTVTFNHAGFLTTAQQQHAQSVLQQCATQSSNAYLATDANSLNTAFTAIAVSATAGNLRLIK